uniref:Heteropteran venom family 2 protein 8 n=1 Tax=Ectomocoris sp. TaxID=3104572 RepID=A0AB38ZEI8_9HEMI
MNLILFVFIGLFVNVLGRSTKDLSNLSQDEYTARALAELKAMNRSRFLSDLQAPKCEIFKEELAIECSLKFRWISQPRKIAVRVALNLQRVQLIFTLSFDDEELFEHKVDLAQICVPLPGKLKQIEICAHAYYIDVDTRPPRISFDACFVIKLGDFFHLRLNCVSLNKKGKFSHHAKYEPEDEGIIVLSIEEGNVKFKLNNPIPKEIMDEIEKGWKDFEKEAKKSFDKAGKELEKVGKEVEKGFKEAGKQVGRGVAQTGKQVVTGVNKAGKELTKVGKDIKKGVDQAGFVINKIGKGLGKLFG